jgi:hypothetical protein
MSKEISPDAQKTVDPMFQPVIQPILLEATALGLLVPQMIPFDSDMLGPQLPEQP